MQQDEDNKKIRKEHYRSINLNVMRNQSILRGKTALQLLCNCIALRFVIRKLMKLPCWQIPTHLSQRSYWWCKNYISNGIFEILQFSVVHFIQRSEPIIGNTKKYEDYIYILHTIGAWSSNGNFFQSKIKRNFFPQTIIYRRTCNFR